MLNVSILIIGTLQRACMMVCIRLEQFLHRNMVTKTESVTVIKCDVSRVVKDCTAKTRQKIIKKSVYPYTGNQ